MLTVTVLGVVQFWDGTPVASFSFSNGPGFLQHMQNCISLLAWRQDLLLDGMLDPKMELLSYIRSC